MKMKTNPVGVLGERMISFCVTMTREQAEQLDDEAWQRRMNRSAAVREAVASWLAHENDIAHSGDSIEGAA